MSGGYFNLSRRDVSNSLIITPSEIGLISLLDKTARSWLVAFCESISLSVFVLGSPLGLWATRVTTAPEAVLASRISLSKKLSNTVAFYYYYYYLVKFDYYPF